MYTCKIICFNSSSNKRDSVVQKLVDVQDLLQYNEDVRHRYFEFLAQMPWAEFTKNREASFHSMRNIFVHALDAIDYWLDFLQGENLRSKRKYDDYKTCKEVKSYMEHVEKRMHEYIKSLPKDGLSKKYTAKGDGKTVEITAEDVLVHVFEEEVHHRGELIALLWQMNIEPPMMGWKGL